MRGKRKKKVTREQFLRALTKLVKDKRTMARVRMEALGLISDITLKGPS